MGYTLQGESNQTCAGSSAIGSWTGSQPTCLREYYIKSPGKLLNDFDLLAVECGSPGAPVNGVILGDSFHFNDAVQFKCLPGYMLHGAAQTTCLHTGQWSDAKPSCQGKNSLLNDLIES